jgi:hypothetical protein
MPNSWSSERWHIWGMAGLPLIDCNALFQTPSLAEASAGSSAMACALMALMAFSARPNSMSLTY